MSDLKIQYDNLKKQRKIILNELKPLEESETVKRYLELKKQNTDLYNQQKKLYNAILEEKYASCKHILVYSRIESDDYEGRKYKYCGCIKCGLNNSVSNGDYRYVDEGVMYNYLKKHSLRGIETKIACDLDLAMAIYSRIKQVHPDIDDKTAIKYFEIALDNIRNIKVKDERKVSRAKRLLLNPEFNRWKSSDV